MKNKNSNKEITKHNNNLAGENEISQESQKFCPLSSNRTNNGLNCININNESQKDINQIFIAKAESDVKYINNPGSSNDNIPVSPKQTKSNNKSDPVTSFTVNNKTEFIYDKLKISPNIYNKLINEPDTHLNYEARSNHSDEILEEGITNKLIKRSQTKEKQKIKNSYTKKSKSFVKANKNHKTHEESIFYAEMPPPEVENSIVPEFSLSNRRLSLQYKSSSHPTQTKNSLPVVSYQSSESKMFIPQLPQLKIEQAHSAQLSEQNIDLAYQDSETKGSIPYSTKNKNTSPIKNTENISLSKNQSSLNAVSAMETSGGIKTNSENLNVVNPLMAYPPLITSQMHQIDVKNSNIIEKKVEDVIAAQETAPISPPFGMGGFEYSNNQMIPCDIIIDEEAAKIEIIERRRNNYLFFNAPR